ncbi:MAG: sulfurtransferase [Candidatus Eiseniibacteriota bacterium]
MRTLLSAAALLVATAFGASAEAAQPLVSVDWLEAHLGQPNLVVLDVRSPEKGQPADLFERAHIPGAVHADYAKAGWRTTINGVPGMLPPKADLEKLIGGLGIDNKSHVVIVPAGTDSTEFGDATRVYWTFKVVGHENVSILDGGFRAWTADRTVPLEAGPSAPKAKSFVATIQPRYLATKAEVQQALKDGTKLIDARPAAQYEGTAKSPVVKSYGTLPGAVNLEHSSLVSKDTGKFASSGTVKTLLAKLGVTSEGKEIAFCNTGHWASVAWFAASEVAGNKSAKMYDGSMAEWTADAADPVERKAPVTAEKK